MRQRRVSLALVIMACAALFACVDDAPPGSDSARFMNATGQLEPDQQRWIVSPTGIGPLRFGMTTDAIAAALGDSSLAATLSRSGCTRIRPRQLPPRASLLLSDGQFVRIDVDSSGVLLDTGLQVGDSEVAVMVMYSGRVRVESDKERGPPSHVLTVTPPADTAHLLLFTTDGSNVTSYRVGMRPVVDLAEGCS